MSTHKKVAMTKLIFISADHGMAIVYFLQSDVVSILLNSGINIVLLTDDETKDKIEKRFGHSARATQGRGNLIFEGLRLKQANAYAKSVQPLLQWLLAFLRRVGGSWRINNEAQNSHIREVWAENSWKFRIGIWIPAALATIVLRSSRLARKALVQAQSRFTPHPGLYTDLFDKYQPDLVVASTPGWRIDRYLLREAGQRGVRTATVIVGWDNPSSYAVPGANVEYAICWSQIQKDELVNGSDWDPKRVFIGGMPSYDGYIRKTWLMSKDAYFLKHGLDPHRKLISYASSFVHFAPNYPNVETLAKIVASDSLAEPAQLLVRLHPSHFQDKPVMFADERARIHILEQKYQHVHIVRPVALGGSLGYYSGEDMDEKASMMAYSDVFVTVYSTMVVETAIHDTPIIAAVIDTPGGWNSVHTISKGASPVRDGQPKKFSLSLMEIGEWPTHQRFRLAKAGRVAENEQELVKELNAYLQDRAADARNRRNFIVNEITFTDGKSGLRTAELILNFLGED